MKGLEKKLPQKEEEIYEKLKEVKDPEFMLSMMERNPAGESFVEKYVMAEETNKAVREM